MISIIIPTYQNSHELRRELPVLLGGLETAGIGYELIIVDDGSERPQEAREVAESFGARFLSNPSNLGKGAAIRKGVLAARGKKILFTDADIPFEFSAVQLLIDSLDEADLVIGDRNLQDSEYHENSRQIRSIASNLYTFLVGRFLTKGLYDTQCGLKGFRSEVAKDLFSTSKISGFAFDVEILYLALKKGYKLTRIPVKLRYHGESTVKVWKHAPQMMADLIRIRLNDFTGRY